MKGLSPDIVQVYQEVMPSDSQSFKESVNMERQTLARIEQIRLGAALRGQWIYFQPQMRDSEHLFEEPKRGKKENLPTFKFGELPKSYQANKDKQDRILRD